MPLDLVMRHVLEKGFDVTDCGHKGYLTEQDVRKALSDFDLDPNRAPEFMQQFDTNKDGKISKQEYEYIKRRFQDKQALRLYDVREFLLSFSCAMMRKTFQEIDKYKQKKLSEKELESFLKTHRELIGSTTAEQLLKDYDKDGDKCLNYTEFLEMVADYL
ncbi:unnamed protein product [Calicophoron daubneyi]|uniref:EF-hand domain-containing protein n=1 Tax=Calicophoron daubneyi TaxID=300641 RepID=A0AAV2TNM1_CALDB